MGTTKNEKLEQGLQLIREAISEEYGVDFNSETTEISLTEGEENGNKSLKASIGGRKIRCHYDRNLKRYVCH
ncbi:hypothetical protein [Pararcticibacter amylolyticus]|uniref:Uncharacterized protein n=1 Tax=Pararcticibacter amylolyticus TaxID=2173175 RepID=A0A2U2PBE9_9SPHI|nr:hypothetical protein [Pararcticibacter amylolyticus]PWG78712.1 hypothetical protein DDR33_21060 [Pararcticibacter amylolyticus]